LSAVNIPDYAAKIIAALTAAGHEAFIVGGCVRDMIRGATPGDWDIATSARPDEVKGLFSRTFDTGIKHGTVSVLCGSNVCEVTTYRIDGEYSDNRRPATVTFAGKIEEDLSRRDFTINAIAYNPTRGFVDPFDGRGDISRKIIKCVGDAETRFGEDALRMLRAIRFAAVLGFCVNSDAVRAITKLRDNLADISGERIREELCKLLCGAHPDAAKLLRETGIMRQVLRGRDFGGNLDEVVSRLQVLSGGLCPPNPLQGGITPPLDPRNEKPREARFFEGAREAFPQPGKRYTASRECVASCTCSRAAGSVRFAHCCYRCSVSPKGTLSKALALFFAWADDECEYVLRDLRFDNKTIRTVSRFVQNRALPGSRYEIKKLMRIFPPDEFEDWLHLQEISQKRCFEKIRAEAADILTRGECFTLRGLAVNGNDLAEVGITGKAAGEALEKFLDAVMRDPQMNVKERLL